ncbi:family 1 glycosylhydrolase [Holdemania massiliensis]|uniref:Family 1 glycosylhydrolase n=1 Tax=Holdemania massiliensis TaxID=1468449 RepID=A0A6N7S981_9FIRM|nr:family 1 glycosylhydrolase [Holdemania massiliensis]MSA72188.1 family 1 glycosylhydrolase [Holdemania massiliensis]MSA90464.1 family 1 glycosylhydrolase [Holdemania massiliensis]MSB79270.1 family 1 glycosylhydrolase [Holdemania massiliensis]MSC34194.1 family 1 glycosylhydrolase [Holdemania massiliensis]MSC40584.1 family 1 glycosylhydrolase [Holdemania massiliensis]
MQKEARQGTAFPDDFLWSASTSAYQFEGHFENDEKGLSVQEVKAAKRSLVESRGSCPSF